MCPTRSVSIPRLPNQTNTRVDANTIQEFTPSANATGSAYAAAVLPAVRRLDEGGDILAPLLSADPRVSALGCLITAAKVQALAENAFADNQWAAWLIDGAPPLLGDDFRQYHNFFRYRFHHDTCALFVGVSHQPGTDYQLHQLNNDRKMPHRPNPVAPLGLTFWSCPFIES